MIHYGVLVAPRQMHISKRRQNIRLAYHLAFGLPRMPLTIFRKISIILFNKKM